ncbi:FUSC family protein [Actinacidiphila reveromycinica]|nr:FUSC family protein [Streptomyces sp. SN-593]
MLIGLRLLDPGRVRLRIAVRTVLAAVAALLVSGAVGRVAGLPGGMVVIATVVAVMVSRTLHATSLPHRLSALVHVPLVGVLAACVGRLMVRDVWFGAAVFVVAVGGSRYVTRFGGRVRWFGRLALTPLIAVLVAPVPPSAARATGPLWGAVCGGIGVACVLGSQVLLPSRPTREAAAAAGDFAAAAARLRTLAPGGARRAKAAQALHRTALAVEDRLDAARLPEGADRAPLDRLAAAVLAAEVAAQRPSARMSPEGPREPPLPGQQAGGPYAGNGKYAAAGAARAGGAAEDRPRPGWSAPSPALPEAAATGLPSPTARPAAPEGAAPLGPGDGGAAPQDGPPHAASPRAVPARAARAPGVRSPVGGPASARGAAAGSAREDDEEMAAALDAVRAAATDVRGVAAGQAVAPEARTPPRRPGGWRNPQPSVRLSAQLTAAMAASFAAGHLLFPGHWTWSVITAFVVCSAARGRGDVVHRSGLRVAGAFAGAVTGTLVAHLVVGDHAVAITLIFCYLLVGLWLRESTYAAWAFCVTSLLAVLYDLGGEQGSAMLLERPAGILLGSACGIAAAYFVLPLPTATVMRVRAGAALRALDDLLSAAREEEPRPARVRELARRFDRANRELMVAAAPARAHRALLRRTARDSAPNPPGAAASPAAPPHAADWADAVTGCAHAARALALGDAAELAAARPHLGLTARNLGQVRRRLGNRPDAAPPRPLRGGPPAVLRLDAALAELYDRLPAPVAPAQPAAVRS